MPEGERKVINLSSTPDPADLDTFNYTGILRNTDGTLVNGTRDIRISIYSQPLNGSVLYDEDFDDVNVREGQFSVVLGDNSASGVLTTDKLITTFETAPLYIALSTDGGSSYIIPRERVHGVPWAISALNSYDGVPVGGIIDFWWPHEFVTFPAEIIDGSLGWRLCDGTWIGDTESPLYNQYLPNLAARFTRGTSVVSGIGIVGGASSYYTTSNGAHRHITWKKDANDIVSDGAGWNTVDWTNNRVGITSTAGNVRAPVTTADATSTATWYTDQEPHHNHIVDVTPPYMGVMKLCRVR